MSDDLRSTLLAYFAIVPSACADMVASDLGIGQREVQDRIEELEKQLRWVLYERDATFKSMLNRAETAEERAEALEELVMDVVADLREGVSASKIDYRIGKVMQKMEWKDE